MSKKTAVIIGLGGIGRSWLKEVRKHSDWEIIGIVDTDTELLENLHSFGIDEELGYISIEDAVQYGEKPDLAIIGTPIYTHHSLAREVLALDINCICEKNMASTIYQAKQMVQAAMDKPHLCTAVGTQYRYGSGPWTARNYLKTNEIGQLGMIHWYSADYRGESRWGWRRWLQDIYLEDMAVHWFDTLRYITEMDIVQVKADVFMPQYSDWHGSSEIHANLALAKPENYHDRHKWVWVQMYGGWQRRGPTENRFEFFGSKGQFKVNDPWGLETKLYIDPNNTTKFEEDGFMPVPDIENLGTNYMGQGVILEMMSRGIDSNGEIQPGTNFKEAFKSFAVSIAATESSREGKTVWVPDYWKNFLD